jgi:hypothetical protein
MDGGMLAAVHVSMTPWCRSVVGALSLVGLLVGEPAVAAKHLASPPQNPLTGEVHLAGAWVGSLGGYPAEDWSHVVIVLQQSGTQLAGTLNDGFGHQHRLDGSVRVDGVVGLDIGGLPGTSECSYLSLYSWTFERDALGRILAFSGVVQGRCFGTVEVPFRLVRARPVRPWLQRPPL